MKNIVSALMLLLWLPSSLVEARTSNLDAAIITTKDATKDTTKDIGVDVASVFDRLRGRAIESSPDVRLADSVVLQQSAARSTSWTRRAPRVDLRVSQTTNKDYAALTGGSLGGFAELFRPREASLSAYQLVAQMPLYNRSTHLGVRRAATELRLARIEQALAKAQVEWSLRQIFGDYLLKVYKTAAIEQSLTVARSTLQDAQVRVKLGDRTIIDVLKAQARLAQLEAQQGTFASDRVESFNRLIDGTGLNSLEMDSIGLLKFSGGEAALADAIERFAEPKKTAQEISLFSSERTELARQIESQSFVFKRIALQQEGQRAQAHALVASEWPELLARATLSKQSESFSSTFSTPETSYSYGLVLNIPLFSFGSLFHLNREANAVIESGDIRARRSSENLISSVEGLVLRGRALVRSIDSLRIGLDRHIEIERLTQKSYQLGKASFLDLQIAQNELLDSKIQLAQAQVELATLYWQIKWNLGLIPGGFKDET